MSTFNYTLYTFRVFFPVRTGSQLRPSVIVMPFRIKHDLVTGANSPKKGQGFLGGGAKMKNQKHGDIIFHGRVRIAPVDNFRFRSG